MTSVEDGQLLDELARLHPAECLIPEQTPTTHAEFHRLSQLENVMLTPRPTWSFAREECHRRLLKHFGTKTLEGFGVDPNSPGIIAAGALLEYVQETQKSDLGHITRLEPYHPSGNLLIDEATRRSLELTRTMRDGKREGSLLAVLDHTVTPMGARLLSDWLSNPLTDVSKIEYRLEAIEELAADALLLRELRELLEPMYDLQRLTARIATGRACPRDLGFLAKTLAQLPPLKSKLAKRRSKSLSDLETALDLCPEVRDAIEAALVEEPPLLTTEGGMIREGFHAQLDELRDLARGGKQWIANYQAQEIERTGIHNLKIGFNKVFGYYLEVTATHAAKVPKDYLRKQTLKNQERYITPELKEHEDKVLRAEESATQARAGTLSNAEGASLKRVPAIAANRRGVGPD